VMRNDLIQKLREVYSSTSIYADHGSAKSIIRGTAEVESHVSFQTSFSRPNLRWDFSSKQPSPVPSEIGWIRSDEKQFVYGSNVKKEQSYLHLSDVLSIAVARGATQACTFVPSLLFADSDSTNVFDCQYVEQPEENWQDEAHYKLTAQHENYGQIELWISKRQHLLSRVVIPAQDLASVLENILSNTWIQEQLAAEEKRGHQMLDVLKRSSVLTFDCSFKDIRLSK
jgi:hypothetical protein